MQKNFYLYPMNRYRQETLKKISEESFARQILTMATDLLRARDESTAKISYECTMEILDEIGQAFHKATTLRELRRFREVVAENYLRGFDPQQHKDLLEVLLNFTPESARQIDLIKT